MELAKFFRPQNPSEGYLLSAQPMYSVRKPLAESMRVKTSRLPKTILTAFERIEDGVGNYCWAFEYEDDAHQFQQFSHSSHFRRYSRPQSMEEAGTDLLAQLLPRGCTEIITLVGTLICGHPFIGPRAGAGTVQTEAPWTIPRRYWLNAYGFGIGRLVLIEIDVDAVTEEGLEEEASP